MYNCDEMSDGNNGCLTLLEFIQMRLGHSKEAHNFIPEGAVFVVHRWVIIVVTVASTAL